VEVNKKRAAAAKDCFKYNPKLNEVHVTDDLECFGDRSNAVNHARTLEDKTIDVFIRDEDNVQLDEPKSKAETTKANTQPDAKLAQTKAAGTVTKETFKTIPAKTKAAKAAPVVKTPAEPKAKAAPKAKVTKEIKTESTPAVETVENSDKKTETIITPAIEPGAESTQQ